jgi:hypothetical protein
MAAGGGHHGADGQREKGVALVRGKSGAVLSRRQDQPTRPVAGGVPGPSGAYDETEGLIKTDAGIGDSPLVAGH